MSRRTWRVVVPCALALVGGAGACIIWDNGDSPAPILGTNGALTITPDKVTIPLLDDSDGGSPQSFRFVIKGRIAGGLGAESVPVDVIVAACPDAGAALADPSRFRDIALSGAPDGGCRTDSPTSLRCVLSPDGVAAFDVRTEGVRTTTYQDAIPICVLPPREDPTAPQQARVFIGSLAGDLEATIEVATEPTIGIGARDTSPSDCAQGLLSDCDSFTRARPVRIVAHGDGGGPVPTNPARAALNVTENTDGGITGATLARDERCEGQATVIDLLVSSPQTDSHVFLCARGRAGQVKLRGVVVGQSELEDDVDVTIAAQPARVVREGEDVRVQDCEGRPLANVEVSLQAETTAVAVVPSAGGRTDQTGSAGRVIVSGDAGDGTVVVNIPGARQSCRLKVTR